MRIRAAKALDGTGKVLSNVTITSRDPKSRRSARTIRVPRPTTWAHSPSMPGMIDVHAHVGWHFDKDGRYAASPGTPAQEILYSAENAYVTLMAGFTTIQSPGQANDVELRDGDRARRAAGPAHPDLDPPDQRAQRHAGRDPRESPPAEGRRRRRHQDLRVREHPRRRQADDDRRAAAGGVRRSERHRHAHDGPRAQPGVDQGVGQRRLPADRARRVRDRRSAEADGRQRRLLRSQRRRRAAELPGEQATTTSASATTTRKASRSWRKVSRSTTR